MRRVLMAAAIALGMASASYAAPILCDEQDVIEEGVLTAPVVFTCNPGGDNQSGDGLDVISIRLLLSGSFSGSNGSGDYGLRVEVTSDSLTLFSGLFCQASDTATGDLGTYDNSCTETTLFIGVPGGPTDELGPFTVTVTPTIPNGLNTPFSGSATVAYEVQARQDGEIPEPASMALLGTGLLGLGLMARRRARK